VVVDGSRERDGMGSMMRGVVMSGRRGSQDTWGVVFGSGSYTDLGSTLPSRNLHNYKVACTTHARHSGTCLLEGSSDNTEIDPPAAVARG